MNSSTIALSLVTVILWGIIPILDKLALAQYASSPMVGIVIRSAGVTALSIPLALAFGGGRSAFKAMPPSATLLYLASGLISLLLAQYAYYALLRHVQVSRVFPFLFSAAPLVTVLLGAVILREPLSAKQLLGAFLVVLGGVLLL
jgi:drug/metabolite transporter (DMT)-like permease